MKRMVVAASLAVMLGLASHPAAQSPAGPAFEVASIKPSNPDATGPFGGPPLPVVRPPAGGRFTATNITLRDLVRRAYDSWFDFQIEGGPDWQTSRRFDIQANAEDPTADLGTMAPMLKALLADRFQLKVHTETREMPVYALMVARDDGRLGAQITRSTADCSKAAQEHVEITRAGGIAERCRQARGCRARSCPSQPARPEP